MRSAVFVLGEGVEAQVILLSLSISGDRSPFWTDLIPIENVLACNWASRTSAVSGHTTENFIPMPHPKPSTRSV